MTDSLKFSVFRGLEMSPAQWNAVSELFSSEYGNYSRFVPKRTGERMRLRAMREKYEQ